MRIEISEPDLARLNDGEMVTIYRDGETIEIYIGAEVDQDGVSILL